MEFKDNETKIKKQRKCLHRAISSYVNLKTCVLQFVFYSPERKEIVTSPVMLIF